MYMVQKSTIKFTSNIILSPFLLLSLRCFSLHIYSFYTSKNIILFPLLPIHILLKHPIHQHHPLFALLNRFVMIPLLNLLIVKFLHKIIVFVVRVILAHLLDVIILIVFVKLTSVMTVSEVIRDSSVNKGAFMETLGVSCSALGFGLVS